MAVFATLWFWDTSNLLEQYAWIKTGLNYLMLLTGIWAWRGIVLVGLGYWEKRKDSVV